MAANETASRESEGSGRDRKAEASDKPISMAEPSRKWVEVPLTHLNDGGDDMFGTIELREDKAYWIGNDRIRIGMWWHWEKVPYCLRNVIPKRKFVWWSFIHMQHYHIQVWRFKITVKSKYYTKPDGTRSEPQPSAK